MASILILDGTLEIREMLKRGLSDEGHCLLIFETGRRAMQAYVEGEINLVIISDDIFSDGANGVAVCAQMRLLKPNQKIILMVASLAPEEHGASIVLKKPFTIGELMVEVKKLLR